MDQQNSVHLFKILVIGKVYAGKTCCIKRLVYNTFTNSYKTTLGVDFAATQLSISQDEIQEYLSGNPPSTQYTAPNLNQQCSMNISLASQQAPCYEGGRKISLPKTHPIYSLPSVNIRIQLWDIAGQERYTNITRAYYRGAVAAVIIGDLESPTFYEDILSWKKDVDEKVRLLDTDQPIPCMLCCNKIDTEASIAWYSDHGEELSKFVHDNGFVGMYTTSALTGVNLRCAFQHLCVVVLAKTLMIQRAASQNPAVVILSDKSNDKNTRTGCC